MPKVKKPQVVSKIEILPGLDYTPYVQTETLREFVRRSLVTGGKFGPVKRTRVPGQGQRTFFAIGVQLGPDDEIVFYPLND